MTTRFQVRSSERWTEWRHRWSSLLEQLTAIPYAAHLLRQEDLGALKLPQPAGSARARPPDGFWCILELKTPIGTSSSSITLLRRFYEFIKTLYLWVFGWNRTYSIPHSWRYCRRRIYTKLSVSTVHTSISSILEWWYDTIRYDRRE